MTTNSVWCPNDYSAILHAPTSGQLTPHSHAGKYIMELVRTMGPHDTILDIGTWTGNGSTLCFLQSLKDTSYNQFISIECNEDKNKLAIRNLSSLITEGKDNILWGSILSPDEVTIEKTQEVFPIIKDNSEFKRWHMVDIKNIELCPNIIDRIPESLDIVLFDGGEFTTYFEFFKLLPRCKKFILMDDCNVDKCKIIREYLNAQTNWSEIMYINERNGFCVFKHTY